MKERDGAGGVEASVVAGRFRAHLEEVLPVPDAGWPVRVGGYVVFGSLPGVAVAILRRCGRVGGCRIMWERNEFRACTHHFAEVGRAVKDARCLTRRHGGG